MTCPSRYHADSTYAYGKGCRCPGAVAAIRARWRRSYRKQMASRGSVVVQSRSRDPHIDEVAVRRAVDGETLQLTIPERGEVIARLTRQGLSAREIATRLGIAQRTVVRHRSGDVKCGRAA